MDNSGNISTTELRGALAKAGKSDLVSHQSQDLYSQTHLIYTHNSVYYFSQQYSVVSRQKHEIPECTKWCFDVLILAYGLIHPSVSGSSLFDMLYHYTPTHYHTVLNIFSYFRHEYGVNFAYKISESVFCF